jgi:hypothetical protein
MIRKLMLALVILAVASVPLPALARDGGHEGRHEFSHPLLNQSDLPRQQLPRWRVPRDSGFEFALIGGQGPASPRALALKHMALASH